MLATQEPIFLEASDIYLRPLHADDANGPYPFWLNDDEVCRGTSHHIYPYTKKSASEYIEQANAATHALILAIVTKNNNKHIGNIALQQINWVYRRAEFAILLGDKSIWGKGYGYQAAKLIIDHGFNALNLHRIECATFENNQGMCKLAQALGMQQEGLRRQSAFKNNKFLDIIEFGILREEYIRHESKKN